MSSFKFNPNAGEWKPTFTVSTAASASPALAIAASSSVAATPVVAAGSVKAAKPTPITTTTPASATATATATATPNGKKTPAATPVAVSMKAATPKVTIPVAGAGATDTASEDVDMEQPTPNRITYSVEFLLQFQYICDAVPCYFPDVVRAPAPQRLGRFMNGRLVYSVPELMQFQPLYHTLPSNIEFTETLSVPMDPPDKKAKTPSVKASKKEKAKLKAAAAAAAAGNSTGPNGTSTTNDAGSTSTSTSASASDQLQYDPTLMSYFNPTEYAAALSMAVYSTHNGDNGDSATTGRATNSVEEAVVAKRRLAALLDTVQLESVSSVLQSFEEIAISYTHTLQEVIALLFDRAIAKPDLCDAYAQLCSGMAERTPEFKEGAKTINFRRILLTRCYEALIEEPEPPTTTSSLTSTCSTTTTNGPTTATAAVMPQHSWRRQCMLQNVCLVGELFRRQLLTENIMHVCVAMMLEDELQPQMDVVEAACRLLNLVGDLLDGSSPASRRTMDEYFDVLQRLADHAVAPQTLRDTIVELTALRGSGWTKKRLDAATTSTTTMSSTSTTTTTTTTTTSTSSTSATVATTAAPVASAPVASAPVVVAPAAVAAVEQETQSSDVSVVETLEKETVSTTSQDVPIVIAPSASSS